MAGELPAGEGELPAGEGELPGLPAIAHTLSAVEEPVMPLASPPLASLPLHSLLKLMLVFFFLLASVRRALSHVQQIPFSATSLLPLRALRFSV